MKAIMIYEFGGPEVLKLEERPTPAPGPGQALVQIAATGVNFVEIYQRMGWYQIPLPSGLGGEGAGVVLEVGPDASLVKPGDRVAFLSGSGAYATHALVPVEKLVPTPDDLSLEEAAASMVQGLTAHVLATRTYPVKPDDRVLVHAAAGGVGRLLCQIAKMQGAFVIGTVSSDAKAQIAREAGADEVVIYTQEEFGEAVKRITGGKGVNVAYDSVGKDTFDRSLDSLAMLGYLVSYGQSSGFPPPLDIQRLAGGRSLFVTRPTVFSYTSTREELLAHAEAVFGMIIQGKLKLHIDRTYPLEEAAEAQKALASRQTVGKLLLIP
jgi:NADPH2:quinone reductase